MENHRWRELWKKARSLRGKDEELALEIIVRLEEIEDRLVSVEQELFYPDD